MEISKSSMVRWLLILPAVIIAYFIILMLTGSAGKPSVDLVGSGSAQEREGQEPSGTGSVSEELAAALREKESELDRREADIARREQELAVWEKDLQRLRRELNDDRQALENEKAAFAQQEKERNGERVKQVAQTLKSTKANIAALQLQALYQKNRATALFVLSQLDSRSAGKIFSKMTDTQLAAQILEDFESWKVGNNSGANSASR